MGVTAGMHQFLRHIELRRDTVSDWNAYPFSIPAIAALDGLGSGAGPSTQSPRPGNPRRCLVSLVHTPSCREVIGWGGGGCGSRQG
jgi:hypothetical protein